jgi:hypothetical protein
LWCPAHLLFFDHTFADHLVDGGFDERGGDGTVNLVANAGVRGSLGQDGVAVVLWSGGCGGQSGDLVPGGESGGHLVSVLGCGESVASRPEVG